MEEFSKPRRQHGNDGQRHVKNEKEHPRSIEHHVLVNGDLVPCRCDPEYQDENRAEHREYELLHAENKRGDVSWQNASKIKYLNFMSVP